MKVLLLLLLLFPAFSFSQLDSTIIARIKNLETSNTLSTDTITVAEDALTKKIRQLRNLRKGLTTETIIQIKLMEERQKDTTRSKEYYDQLTREMTTGKTGRLIDNCLINLYRKTFTEKEIDDLIRFYKTPAGKKMDKDFIFLMLQSVKDAEQLMKTAMENVAQEKNR
ncbi:MAG TPA: DUF2059 domain-containing protein [Flavitalea sp.]|nr:DUF2059 domain-containing protein [Flavitalea sp.]